MSAYKLLAHKDFRQDVRGATLVEFAIVAMPLIVMMMAMFDLGFREYISIQLAGALDQSARQVTVGTATNAAAIKASVTTQIRTILPGATVNVIPSSYDAFSKVGKPEPITTDTAPIGVYNKGDCFEDENGNGVWDSDSGLNGTGGSDDIVYYTAIVTYPEIVPMRRLLGWPATETVTGTAMMKNQPYASQADPAVICS
ncbi:TadE/TadG family type IV pilus assembly protein [Sphingomonas sp. PP-CC-3G-468]|uniref:TadE/TadG family type IV pilus assembly protein n=1 Tax=Sphingomonas sp. PP-CC-3G-468 TaxID=2135656 RepID=UPI0010442682|nr:TadE/TadG family type IV pilus assembly protein [Sphingomonas sp. PP-CC-3G-468]TCM01179.1 TadE-like protein [Sphingomonas sp. PP-CC-3G-468]